MNEKVKKLLEGKGENYILPFFGSTGKMRPRCGNIWGSSMRPISGPSA